MLLTFHPHPQQVISPAQAPPLLQTQQQKQEILEELGLEVLIRLPFTRRLSLSSPQDFVREVLAPLAPREVHVGVDFRFGHRRSGDLAILQTLGREYGFRVCPTRDVCFRGSRISSTRVRRALLAGQVALARRLLGRPYQLYGTVIRGSGRGIRLGFPTANIQVENELVPADGVYVGRLVVESSHYLAATNIGRRPTFDAGGHRVVESHLPGFAGDLYGRPVRLEFCLRLRGEEKFADVEALRHQIERDLRLARRYASRVGYPPTTEREVD